MRIVLSSLILVLISSFSSFASDEQEVQTFTQNFYNNYYKISDKLGDTEKWFLSSDQVTDSFKKVYKKFMKEDHGYDPIFVGQDIPERGYLVKKVSVQETKAVATLESDGFVKEFTFKVYLVKKNNRWLINGVEDVVGK